MMVMKFLSLQFRLLLQMSSEFLHLISTSRPNAIINTASLFTVKRMVVSEGMVFQEHEIGNHVQLYVILLETRAMACINGETSNLFVVLATINNSPNWHRIESDVNFVETFQVALLYKCNGVCSYVQRRLFGSEGICTIAAPTCLLFGVINCRDTPILSLV